MPRRWFHIVLTTHDGRRFVLTVRGFWSHVDGPLTHAWDYARYPGDGVGLAIGRLYRRGRDVAVRHGDRLAAVPAPDDTP